MGDVALDHLILQLTCAFRSHSGSTFEDLLQSGVLRMRRYLGSCGNWTPYLGLDVIATNWFCDMQSFLLWTACSSFRILKPGVVSLSPEAEHKPHCIFLNPVLHPLILQYQRAHSTSIWLRQQSFWDCSLDLCREMCRSRPHLELAFFLATRHMDGSSIK